ncbi:MAG: CHAT domain-containing protein, partial [Candidatus Eisenbacteria bacterium]
RAWAASRRARERDRGTRSGEGAVSEVRPSLAIVPTRLRRDLAGGLPEPLTAAQLRGALEPDKLLINYMRHRGRIEAILVTRRACSAVRSLVSDDTLQRLVHGMLFELRGAAASGTSHGAASLASLSELAAFVLWPALARDFGDRPPKRLVVVPSGLLARIPWPVMPLPDGQPLCMTSDIVVVPGLRLGMVPSRGRRGGGVPLIVASDVEGLEHAQAEAREIADLFPDARLLLGNEATAERFLKLAPAAPWIHFAGHGRYQADEPFHSGLRLHDRWIVAEELATTRLSAEWISLSACQTARALIRPGEEWFGLPRTLLQAGARAVIAPQWDIEDASAVRLMLLFYEGLKSGATISRALASAQSARWKAGDHPIDWAGFVMLSGLGAGRIVPFPSGRIDTMSPTPSGGLS